MRIGAVVQARLGSTRLPGKVLMDLAGKTVLERVLERTAKIRGVDEVILATNTDRELTKIADRMGHKWLLMNAIDENDVLARYHSAASMYELDAIVRITADCPLLDPEVSSRVVAGYLRGEYDYYANTHPPTFPDGLDTEVFSFGALCRAYTHARNKEREHVTPYIYKRPNKFMIGNLMNPRDLSHHRWTLDTIEDYQWIKGVYEHFDGEDFTSEDILEQCIPRTLTRSRLL